ncbi:MAG TPA: thioredoxin family protein [Lysobacter sp.]
MNTAIAEPSTVDHQYDDHPVVSRDRWLAQRLTLLAREKELTRLQDQIARERRALPWVRVDKDYVFDTPEGKRTLAELFDGRSQLFVQHFMFAPGWEQGCKSCSYMADHNDGTTVHLAQRDVTLLAVSRAPLAEIERFRQRMGWKFKWVSSLGTDFNHDFGVNFSHEERSTGKVEYNYKRQPFPHEEAPGISVFVRDDSGQVFHTYSRYGRGVEVMMHTYNLLELTPKGRDEDGLEYPMAWVRHHDLYEADAPAKTNAACCGSHD